MTKSATTKQMKAKNQQVRIHQAFIRKSYYWKIKN